MFHEYSLLSSNCVDHPDMQTTLKDFERLFLGISYKVFLFLLHKLIFQINFILKNVIYSLI